MRYIARSLVHAERSADIPSLIAYIACLVASVVGLLILDRVGRRKLLILGSFACSICLMGSMVSASQSGIPLGISAPSTNPAASRASIACFVFFLVSYGISYQPLLPTYPGEVLSTDQRGTGMGLTALTSQVASKPRRYLLISRTKSLVYSVHLALCDSCRFGTDRMV
jgi:MFS family permease